MYGDFFSSGIFCSYMARRSTRLYSALLRCSLSFCLAKTLISALSYHDVICGAAFRVYNKTRKPVRLFRLSRRRISRIRAQHGWQAIEPLYAGGRMDEHP